jgi:hypothetical protein
MSRISDYNKMRKLQFGQATLLGVHFEKKVGWSYTLPSNERLKQVYWGFAHKYEAVYDALFKMGIDVDPPWPTVFPRSVVWHSTVSPAREPTDAADVLPQR